MTEICIVFPPYSIEVANKRVSLVQPPGEGIYGNIIYPCLICSRRVRNCIETFLYVLMIPRYFISSHFKCFSPRDMEICIM